VSVIDDLSNFLNSGTSIASEISTGLSGLIPTSVNSSGLVNNILSSNNGSLGSSNQTNSPTASSSAAADFRIKLSYLAGSNKTYPGILAPLQATNGMLFPYTPSISWSHEVDYEQMTMTHANTNYEAYARTRNISFSISGKFTVQNQTEGLYALAAIHFLRSCTKMYFGETDASAGKAGIPPPILELNGYGTYMFNHIHCFIRSQNLSFDENAQMVNIKASNGNVLLPAVFTVTVTLQTQTTARAQRKDFSLDKFISGNLMETAPNGNGWI
jgi:hypothetical protein